jgi:hypothetical protein
VPGKREFFYPFAFFVIVILIIISLTWVNSRFIGPVAQPDLFAHYWSAANNWLHKGVNPYNGSMPFDLTFVSMFFIAPFGFLDYAIARTLWLTMLEVSLVIITMLAINISGWKFKLWSLPIILLISLTWYFAARAIFLGEFSVLILLVLMAAFLLITRKQDGIAGFVLAFAIALPSYSFLVIFFIMIWSFAARRYQLFLSFLAGFIFIFAISVILLPDWPLTWLKLTVGNIQTFNWRTSSLSLLSNSVSGIRLPLSIALNGSLLILLISEWLQSLKNAEQKFIWVVLFSMTVNCLIRLNSNACDVLSLLPVLFYTLKVVQDRWDKAADISALVSGIFLLIVPWTIAVTFSRHLQVTPVLTVTLALISMVGLMWVKWWARRPSQLPFEILRDRIG